MTDPRDAELARLLSEVRSLRLQPQDWDAVDGHLAAIGSGDRSRIDDLSQAVFEARIRGRFSGPRGSAGVAPTKQTSVLPIVGLVCGGLLVGVGALLGGGPILWGIVALGVFVFGIAFAGSRVAHRPRGEADDEDAVEPVPIPDQVALRVNAIGRAHGAGR
ncbi:MAG TPA: hypothetical protein DCS55_08120 [Acidimicrobiaceae bacterium]|nr:hypothetical protein [Acidimicrobiaceae bacterium]